MSTQQTSISQWVRSNIRALVPYSSARSEFKGKAEVFLDANENPFETGLNRYPDPLQWHLKEKISALKGVSLNQIFLGNGSDEAIDLVVRIFCEPRQDNIVILPPTYGMYQVSADIADVGLKRVSLTPDFQLNVKEILASADEHSKVLFICSPNNPTGNDINLSDIEALCAQFPGMVVVDEAYIDFSEQASCISLLPKYPNLIVMQTFSKAWGMAGLRLGMAFANAEVIHYFNKVKAPYNLNQLTQSTALEALENKKSERDRMVKILLEERQKLEEVCLNLPYVQKVYPSDANFILVKMSDPNAVYDYLVEQGIIVRNRNTVHLCEGSLRITVGRPEENETLIKALKNWKNV
jgi:histidinol-phosphate aminotransferase